MSDVYTFVHFITLLVQVAWLKSSYLHIITNDNACNIRTQNVSLNRLESLFPWSVYEPGPHACFCNV